MSKLEEQGPLVLNTPPPREGGEWEAALSRVQIGADSERVEAVRAVARAQTADYERILPVLCQALQDPLEDVRVAAGEELGRIGEDRAIQPLREALQRCFPNGSARRQLVLGLVVVGILALVFVGYVFGAFYFRMGGMLAGMSGGMANGIRAFRQKRLAKSRECQTYTRALAAIAERTPSPVLRSLVPELNALAADVWHDGAVRDASREAAQRIEAVTAEVKSLPVASAAAVKVEKDLPRAAEAAEPDGECLPRAVTPAE